MRSAVRFSSIVGRATLIVTVGSIGLILALSKFGFDPDKKSKAALPVLILTVLSPTCAAAVWMFRKLRKIYSAREARAVATVFGVCAPIFLAVSMVFGEITGGYAEALGGRGFFILIGAFGGPFLLTALLSLLVCALALRITRLTMEVEQND